MQDFPVSLIIGVASVLVGLLCLWLMLVALLRLPKARKGKGAAGESPADLKSFALKQGLSAIVMFALAAIIFVFS